MFERFTDRARRVVVLAQEEARLLNHDVIGTEHVLLGLTAAPPDSVAHRVLSGVGIDVNELRREVEDAVGQGRHHQGDGHIPFTPPAKQVFELALREALQLGHRYIGTEHLLLGIVRQGDGVAAQILIGRGLELPELRHAVIQTIADGTTEAMPPADDEPIAIRRTVRGDRTVASAPFAAGPGPGASSAPAPVHPADRVTPGLLAVVFVLVGVVAAGIDRPPTALGRVALGVLLVGLVAAGIAAAKPALSPPLARRLGLGGPAVSALPRVSFAVAVLAFGTASGILVIDTLVS
ncbi:MAG: Clp protease N-terminal domain-containing protein [Actinomycetota bacterium]